MCQDDDLLTTFRKKLEEQVLQSELNEESFDNNFQLKREIK